MPVLILAFAHYLIGGYGFWLTLLGVGVWCSHRQRRQRKAAEYAERWHEAFP